MMNDSPILMTHIFLTRIYSCFMFHYMTEIIDSVRKLRDAMVKVDVIDIMIMRCIASGAVRYTDIHNCVKNYGIELRNALANRLLKLRGRGYVVRSGEIYTITEDGEKLLAIVRAVVAV